MASRLLKKISATTVCPDLLQRLDVPGAPAQVPLFDVYGFASGIKTSKPDSERQWCAFIGEFEAVRIDTGEVSVSGKCFIPQPMQDMLFGRIMQQKEVSTDGGANVQFAIRVKIVAPAKGRPSITGYEFQCETILESNDSSPMQSLRDQAKAAVLALSAPKAAPAPAVEAKKK